MGWRIGSFPAAEHAADRVLSLPMHPYLEPRQIEEVAEALKVAVRGPVGASAQRV
jgi:UDP-2-acetamido-2-deoxy-ribo-hexuluronate aminotransferase